MVLRQAGAGRSPALGQGGRRRLFWWEWPPALAWVCSWWLSWCCRFGRVQLLWASRFARWCQAWSVMLLTLAQAGKVSRWKRLTPQVLMATITITRPMMLTPRPAFTCRYKPVVHPVHRDQVPAAARPTHEPGLFGHHLGCSRVAGSGGTGLWKTGKPGREGIISTACQQHSGHGRSPGCHLAWDTSLGKASGISAVEWWGSVVTQRNIYLKQELLGSFSVLTHGELWGGVCDLGSRCTPKLMSKGLVVS